MKELASVLGWPAISFVIGAMVWPVWIQLSGLAVSLLRKTKRVRAQRTVEMLSAAAICATDETAAAYAKANSIELYPRSYSGLAPFWVARRYWNELGTGKTPAFALYSLLSGTDELPHLES